MQIQNVSGCSFKGLQCHPNYDEVEYTLANKLGMGGFTKASNLLEELAKGDTYTEVFLGGDLTKPKIYAEVGGKVIKENFFRGPITVLKKALKMAQNLK